VSGAVSFTVVETVPRAEGRRPLLTKIHGPCIGQIQQYDRAEYFKFGLVAVRDSELFEFLTIHGPQPHRGLVRGAPAFGVDFGQPQRRLLDKQPDGATPTLDRGVPVGWAAFDLDRSLPVPGIDWRTHPREAAEAIAQRDLPPWATEADYVAYYSGSQGFADAMKLRVFVLLERPITSADLKRLMKAGTCPVDLALYSDAQLHYTATPMFTGSVVDPLPNGRHYFFKGIRRRALAPPLPPTLNATLRRVPAAATDSAGPSLMPFAMTARRVFGGRGGSSSAAIEAVIATMGEQSAGKAGFHVPWNRALAIFYAQNCPDADPRPLIVRLARVIMERGERDQTYVTRAVHGMFGRARVLAALERKRGDASSALRDSSAATFNSPAKGHRQ
jgi:hypothetical protein